MPPKRKNKQSKNGYWQFYLELRDKPCNKNRTNEELQAHASALWAKMDLDQRKQYGIRQNLNSNHGTSGKFTSDGVDLEVIQRLDREKEDRQQEMKNTIGTLLKTASVSNNLEEEVFLIIHINHLVFVPNENAYYICELAIAPFTLKDGVLKKDVFHAIVKPGKLPLGFRGDANSHSQETHQLVAYVQEEPFENNTEEVFRNMIELIKKYCKPHQIPILYSPEKTIQMTRNVIENFCDKFNYNSSIRIFQLEYMFYALKNTAAKETVWWTETFSFSEIEKDPYNYAPNTACYYHETCDNIPYCSKSIAIRYAYIICSNCSPYFSVPLIPGCHIPQNVKVSNELNISSRSHSKANSVASIGSGNAWSINRSTTASVRSYDSDFPSLSGRRFNNTPSEVSEPAFRPFRARQHGNGVSSIADSVNQISINENRPDYRKLRFPKHGYENRN